MLILHSVFPLSVVLQQRDPCPITDNSYSVATIDILALFLKTQQLLLSFFLCYLCV
jgi:hypothetical protein